MIANCQNKKATPSILAVEVWLVRLHVGWAINRIPYCSSNGCAWLDVSRLAVGLKNRRLILDDRLQQYIHACMQVYQTFVRSILNTIYDVGDRSMHVCLSKRGVAHGILFIAYSFSCDSFDCVLYKNLQFAIKQISHSKPDLRYALSIIRRIQWMIVYMHKLTNFRNQ